jgi:hypothetical protein
LFTARLGAYFEEEGGSPAEFRRLFLVEIVDDVFLALATNFGR